MSNIAIVGFGFVGTAVYEAIKDKHITYLVDPKLNNGNTISSVSDKVNGYIICLPTPQSKDGSCDVSIIEAVLQESPTNLPILIKSTVSLEKWNMLKERFPNHRLTFSPEFLTAANAIEDFKHQEYTYIAGEDAEFWERVFYPCLPHTTIIIENSVQTLILAKYFRNSFLALKVAYANQMYDACKKLGVDYNTLAIIFGDDPRIGTSHAMVPGPDGSRGFGGACFPKDTAALLYTARVYGLDQSILSAAVAYNNALRKK